MAAVDVCSSEIPCLVSSPRISFSHYLNNNTTNTVPIEPLHFDYFHFDFDFNIGNNNFTNLASADEIFSNGKILPVAIKKQVSIPKETQQFEATTVCCENATKKKKLREFFDAEEFPKSLPKYFWKYRRTSSLNGESFPTKTLLRSLHFLSRSNSTGSSLNPKQSKHTQKQNLSKQYPVPVALNSPSLPWSSGHCYSYNSPRRNPSMKKNFRSNSNGGGVRFIPVLNTPYSCIDKGSVISLFGFGSLFCNGKPKKKKK